MCGIVGYIGGNNKVVPLLISGLQKLEQGVRQRRNLRERRGRIDGCQKERQGLGALQA